MWAAVTLVLAGVRESGSSLRIAALHRELDGLHGQELQHALSTLAEAYESAVPVGITFLPH